MPSYFIKSKESIYYLGNELLCDIECDLIINSQQNNGAWGITWSWNGYDKEFSISANWWQSYSIIDSKLNPFESQLCLH